MGSICVFLIWPIFLVFIDSCYLAVYSQVKNLTMGEFASVLGQKKSAAYGRVGVLQIVLSPSGEYTQDLRFAHRTRKFQNIVTRFLRLNLFKSNFVFTFIWGKFITDRHGKQTNLKLTHLSPMHHFSTPCKHQKPYGFLMFPVG